MPPQKSDESRWFAANLHPFEGMLRAWLVARFPSIRDVDDIIQDSYLKVLRAYGKASVNVKDPKAFLFATARNQALDWVRRQKIVRFEYLVENDLSLVLQSEESAMEAASRDRNVELMKEAIQSLPDRCRQVFTLRKVYGYSHTEIAEKLGISKNTVAAQVSIGIRKCKLFVREVQGEKGSR